MYDLVWNDLALNIKLSKEEKEGKLQQYGLATKVSLGAYESYKVTILLCKYNKQIFKTLTQIYPCEIYKYAVLYDLFFYDYMLELRGISYKMTTMDLG